MRVRRWLVPISASAAVVLLLGGLWWFVGPNSSGSSADSSFGGGGSDGSTGSSVPGSPGSAGPGSPGGLSPVPGDGPSLTNPTGVFIDSYYAYDETRLAINYTTGVPACYGEVGDPVVEETNGSVTVTLTRSPVQQDDDVACIDIALVMSVDITLDSPLDDRVVRDGSAGGADVHPGAIPDDPTQAK